MVATTTKSKAKQSKESHSPLVAAAVPADSASVLLASSSTTDQNNDKNEPTSNLQTQVDDEDHVVNKSDHNPSKQKQRQQQVAKSKKRARQEEEDAAEEQRLTALLFGKVETNLQQQVDSKNVESSVITKTRRSKQTSPIPFELDREGVNGIDNSNLFELDREGGDDLAAEATSSKSLVAYGRDEDEDDDEDDNNVGGQKKPSPAAAWVDEDDYGLSVNLLTTSRLRKLRTSRNEEVAEALEGPEFEKRLRKRFQETTQTTARTDWATVPPPVQENSLVSNNSQAAEEEENSEANVLASTSMRLLDSSIQKLPPHVLSIIRCRDANLVDPNQAVVQAVHFHPGSDPDRPLLLTAGLDKTLRFFQCGIEKSEKIHGIHFPKLPIYSAAFLGATGNVLVSGRRSFFYIYDSVAGKLDHVPRIVGREEKSLEKFAVSPDGRIIAFYGNDGYIILVDAATKHWMMDLKMNGSVRAICFTPDGDYLLASGSDGDVYRWDVRTWKCVERFGNEDGTITCSMAASSRHLAVGAESGVVNLYSEYTGAWSATAAAATTTTRTPLKSILNLSTSADAIRFNGDGQILALSTRREKNGLKLLHVPTATVFSNWPTSKTPLSYVWSVDFSPQSRFVAVGNDKGKCLLYRLLHYEQNES